MSQGVEAASLQSPRSDIESEMAGLANVIGLSDVRLVGAGFQFFVYAATHPQYGEVAVRLPRFEMIDTVNDRNLSSALLVEQEYQITSALHDAAIPVAQPYEKCFTPRGLPVLMSALITGGTGHPEWNEVGQLFARIHALAPPGSLPTQPAGIAMADMLAERLESRMASLREARPDLPGLYPQAEIADRMKADGRGQAISLLHLDIRPPNIMCNTGGVLALLDWSNAVIGYGQLELARMSEYAQVDENEIDEAAFRAGYRAAGGIIGPDNAADILYRLDAAIMLALVFLIVIPKPDLAPAQVARVSMLLERLTALW